MDYSLPCSVPEGLTRYLDYFKNNEINFCISGGYAVYRAGFSHCYKDVDVFIDRFNFDEIRFLALDPRIEITSFGCGSDVIETEEVQILKRFELTVSGDKIDFVLMYCNYQIETNYSFSEYITDRFDIDICRVSIIHVYGHSYPYRLVFNSNFKVFMRNECQGLSNDFVENQMCTKTHKRFLKFEVRLKSCYRIFYSYCAPPFDLDHLLKVR